MTFAEFVGSGSTGVVGLINVFVVPALLALSFLAFIWGTVSHFFIHGGEESSRAEGRQFMLWGLIGLVSIIAIWSFVWIVLSTLGIRPAA
ncbi:hypothetical protein COU19_01200 [Candidatus Kaiserbacteria bacterium CG10_big_fil_rev_8_21_14_0_10_56_12]|uniref:DUF4190 domain-containing protein n=1 Tax=Candidatus Kaiserbacteria bacterium CG10_big_fil_rev_8_21_14_0_10_56_12 TaxID=1974611 RepID=A0A2H0UA95_9BACT|nr:MAG: hypothetical protein COU19_01200 [Candidatus Kaiserbacteria bacterium CG10_big_fil_rev_8_21_14_0_10_56_12]